MSLARGPCPLTPQPSSTYANAVPCLLSCRLPAPSSSRAPVRTTCTSSREIGVLASTNPTPANATLAQKVCPPIFSALVSVAPRPIFPPSPPWLPVDPRSPSTLPSIRCTPYDVSIRILQESKQQRKPEEKKPTSSRDTRAPVWPQPVGNPPPRSVVSLEACSESCSPPICR
ncbi:hypothetical protein BDP55DRAFT_106796 [Colletotrichum godetiae]|uniref:Uncharacterized protein n=1 Tax=Colletotrichum godetiae TaxID=1209918 RepID=A0AAJ0EYX5_9PEZI|nr:uncharacterized protein BDP55DRAFT_106796 [Colletotrichum godetiae]KAK1676599.1 hypothetical protein BDP55DRAFT_106796 [Colletotrichum godetiae]